MKKLAMIIGAMLLLTGTAAAEGPSRRITLFNTIKASDATVRIREFRLGADLRMVFSRTVEKIRPLPKIPIAEELLPMQLRERAFSDPSTVAGLHLPLPEFRPLSFVLSADDFNPACGIKINLVW